MKRLAGAALILLILAASAALFRYAFTSGGAAPDRLAPPPVAGTPAPAGEPAAEAPPADRVAGTDAGTEAVGLAPPAGEAPAVPPRAAVPAAPAGPVEPAGLSAAGRKLSGVATIATDGVNVRSTNEYRTDKANVIARLNTGDCVALLGVEKEKKGQHLWYHVKLGDGRTGWVRDDLIKVDENK